MEIMEFWHNIGFSFFSKHGNTVIQSQHYKILDNKRPNPPKPGKSHNLW